MALQRFGARPGLKKKDVGIRRVAPTFGKTTFLTHAHRSTGTLAVESDPERLFALLLGIDPAVRRFLPQPFTLELHSGAILRTAEEKMAARARYKGIDQEPVFYTPDFLLEWCLGTQTAVEVKLEGYTGDAAYARKLGRARAVLWDHGMQFAQVVMPSYWRHPLLTNVPLLKQAIARTDLRPGPEVLEQVERLAESGVATLGGFYAGLQMHHNMGPLLIAFGALRVDVIAHSLYNGTPAVPAHGELDHLSLVGRLAK